MLPWKEQSETSSAAQPDIKPPTSTKETETFCDEEDGLGEKLEGLPEHSGRQCADLISGLSSGCTNLQNDDFITDFSRLVPQHPDKAEQKWQEYEATFKEREMRLEEQIEIQDRKLARATNTLVRTREQLKHLNAEIGLKDSEGAPMIDQDQLQVLLSEKEKRLQAALEEVSKALDDEEDLQQSQEMPNEEQEVQLVELARVTEELADALEKARDGQEEARRELSTVSARLCECDRALKSTRKEKDEEVAALRARIADLDDALAQERQKVNQLQERTKRVELEDQLDQALQVKGKSLKYHHMEI